MQPWRKLLVLLALIALTTAVHGAEDPATPGVADEGDVPEAVVGEEAVEVEAEAGEAMPAAEEEAAVDAVAEEAPARASAASVQWVVTQKMRSQLTKLGYGEEEIAQLDAERADALHNSPEGPRCHASRRRRPRRQ